MMKKGNIGRNDPCPCGSGRKYKKCCMEKADSTGRSAASEEYFEEVRRAMEGNTFTTIEEANDFLRRFNRQRNAAPLENFQGLSPEQMYRFLHFPFDSPWLVTFPANIGVAPVAPVVTLFQLMTEAIGAEGLKATATGNLPRNFCRQAAMDYWGEERYKEKTRFGGINKEDDFEELNVTRFIAEDAGLVRKYKGKFILTKNCHALLSGAGMPAIYPLLLNACTEKYNWGYRDGYPEFNIIQRSFLFTLYLLTLYGDMERPSTFYEDIFVRAFPMALDEAPPMAYLTPETQVRKCYTLRTFVRFAAFFGLADVVPVGKEPLPQGYRVKALPLLREVVQFHISPSGNIPDRRDFH